MVLNEDPAALSDVEYTAIVQTMQENAEAAGMPPCRVAVPAEEVDAALARLDAGGTHG